VTVHILCAMRNAAPFIAECVRSVQAQRHHDWIMLVRDDASTDDSIALLEHLASSEPRIRLVERSTTAIGAAAGYHSLLQHVPEGADVACIDADDTWLPAHLTQSLDALAATPGPALAHGDLEVVDAGLRTLQPSFWGARRITPEPSTVQRIAVDNVVTGSSIVMNAALAHIIRARSAAGAIFQDSWFALAAAAAGKIVARRDITVRYRQHGANTVGAQARTQLSAATAIPMAAKAIGNRSKFRSDLARTTAQAGAFAQSYADLLTPADRDFLERYAALPQRSWPMRALGVLTMRAYPGRTILSALGEALRC
jgi:rhamnosyltransferase